MNNNITKTCLSIVMTVAVCIAMAQDYEKKGDYYFNEGNYGLAVKHYGMVTKPQNASTFLEKERRAKQFRMIMIEADQYFEEGYYENAKSQYEYLYELHATPICKSKIDSCDAKIECIKQERDYYERLYYSDGKEAVDLAVEYLKKFPEGKHYDEVKNGLDNMDDQLWRVSKQDNSIHSYYYYLEVFPKGKYVSEAEEMISDFDDDAWNTAQRINTIESYQNYINGNYSGHVVEAKNRIEGIKREENDYVQCKSSDSEYEIRVFLDKYPKSKHVTYSGRYPFTFSGDIRSL